MENFIAKLGYNPLSTEFDSVFYNFLWDDASNSLVIRNEKTNALVTTLAGKVLVLVNLAQANFSNALIIASPIGTRISAQAYNGGKGITVEKISIANSNFNDWVVTASDDALVTPIGFVPS